ncbi:TIR domain-containing protein [Sphingomonas lutea]|uniref:TIR domain-containing protein n=1 Tax=Sphingomonas lutea TaxID=1045317 RepID=A0A7G9SHD9_9SPHN|nr:TIR domain-containing protein [Sphingomonas lutea]QNN67264.1 TIR domain-containing protein [Sphingomonas lutea]
MSGPDIFLSYARSDRAVARTFAEALTEEGFSVWWDASLHSGETFDEVIEKNLREAKAVVVLWSPRSVASRWVRAEATQADRKNKLVPAMIEPCDRPVIFELTHTADLIDWTGDVTDIHWRTFMDDLRRLVHGSSDFDVPAAARPAAKGPRPQTPVAEPIAPARRPLRPGSDDVISAGRSTPEPAAPATAAPPRAVEDDQPTEIHCLEVEEGEFAGELYTVAGTGAQIGRSAPADIVVPDGSVSRQHCVLGIANDELLVSDLNSTNGTYVDGERVTRATVVPVGSLLQVGQVSMRHALLSRAEIQWRSNPEFDAKVVNAR